MLNSLIPNKSQWKRWTLPSKYTSLGLLAGVIGIVLTIAFYILPPSSKEGEALIKAHQDIIRKFNMKTPENDPYGLSAFRLGQVYADIDSSDKLLSSLKWYRTAMLEGDERAKREVTKIYHKIADHLVHSPSQVITGFYVIDEKNNLIEFDFVTTEAKEMKKDIPVGRSLKWTPRIAGKFKLITCVDITDRVRENDENDNCKERLVTVSDKASDSGKQ